MSNEFKKCPNGHYYQGDHCPYCKTSPSKGDNDSPLITVVYGPKNVQPPTGPEYGPSPIETMPGPMNRPPQTTVVGDGGGFAPTPGPARPSSHTVFEPDDDTYPPYYDGSTRVDQGGYRETRKLVGWLVTYSLDPMGVDFKLYEGRNIIGRNVECNISVSDNMVSDRHAVILFRSGKYSITDSQSSHGTFVNDRDIDLEPCYLQDGDMIRMGKTLFKFKSSF